MALIATCLYHAPVSLIVKQWSVIGPTTDVADTKTTQSHCHNATEDDTIQSHPLHSTWNYNC